jgi:hypothetical protein
MIPPGGFLGAQANTMAAQAALFSGQGAGGSARRRRSARKPKRASSTKHKSATKRASSRKPSWMVKGSLAAKRHMSRIRKLRKK